MREEHRSRLTANRLPSLPALPHTFFCWTTLGTSDKSSFWQTRIFHESPSLEMCGFSVGTWLSLVERCVRDAEVAGSNPVVPTNDFKGLGDNT